MDEKSNCTLVTLPNNPFGVIFCKTDMNKTFIIPIKVPEINNILIVIKVLLLCKIVIQNIPKQTDRNNNNDKF